MSGGSIKTALVLFLAAFCVQNAFSQEDAGFVGTEICATCHKAEFAAWQNSHHDLAMQEPTPESVLGDFDDATFSYHGAVTTFSKVNDEYWVTTEGPEGVPERFPVRYVFGVYPLQQYLLPLEGGRLQALTIAWDSRPKEEGGQRWYHLYPEDNIQSDDPLHWTGPYHNWNARCAECHSTNVRKNFDALTNSYSTEFNAINVGCEACHGPGENHVKAVEEGAVETLTHGGFAVSLEGHRGFLRDSDSDTASSSHNAGSLIENCARCHSRRRTLGNYAYGRSLSDTHLLATLSPPCITWMARFAMRSMSTAHSSRARCTPLVLFVPIVMSLTAISWWQKATPFVVNATTPDHLTPPLITITSRGHPAVSV